MKINSSKFNSIIETLKKTSETSLMLHRHACALVLGGKIVSIGINTYERDTKHAEMNAIRDFFLRNTKGKINRCILIVIRLGRNGEVHPSKPCSSCVNMIKRYNIKRVFYSTYSGFEFEKGCDIQNSHITLFNKLTQDSGKSEKIIA